MTWAACPKGHHVRIAEQFHLCTKKDVCILLHVKFIVKTINKDTTSVNKKHAACKKKKELLNRLENRQWSLKLTL